MIESPTIRAAAERAFDKIHPAFARELEKSPNDPHGAWDRALERTKQSGAFDAPGWQLFLARFFSQIVKPLALKKMEKNWIGNPAFWSLFVRMIANAAEAGGYLGRQDFSKIRYVDRLVFLCPRRVVSRSIYIGVSLRSDIYQRTGRPSPPHGVSSSRLRPLAVLIGRVAHYTAALRGQ
jgi:hypothetical protein